MIALVRDGQLQIDSDGRIWRVAMRHGLKLGGSEVVPVARRRAERRTPNGYLQVRSMVDWKRLHAGAHRLVWQHFHGDIPYAYEINHKNGIKDDNRPCNLTCETPSGNHEHAHRGGLIDQYGQKNPAVKITDNEVAQIRLAYFQGGYTQQKLAERFGVKHQHISRIVRGTRRPKQGGPVSDLDNRHIASDRDPETGRFVPVRVLDGRTWDEFPR